jgi:thiol-disulfide isomerase/thioredoxin
MEVDPLRSLLNGAESVDLATSGGPVEGRDCYCVKIKRPDGATLYWIDQESYILRRIVFPTDELQQEFSQEKLTEKLSLMADFVGAQLNGKADPVAFDFQVPEGSEIVQFFIPPNPSQLLGKKVPDFEFSDAEKKTVTADSLAGKVVIFDFWALTGESCKQSLQNLETVYQKYKGNDKVAFFAVNVDDPGVDDKDVAKYIREWKITMPSLRATREAVKPFLFPGVPTTFLISNGVVQDCEGGVNPKLTEELPGKIEKLLAGEKIYEAAVNDYQEQLKRYGEALEKEGSADNKPGNEPLVEEQPIAPTKTAEHSDPSTFKLASLWNCTELKSPGNILVLQGKNNEPARLLVVENLKSLVEVGLDGKILATHPLTLDEKAVEVVTNLRDYVTKDGKRYVAAFASAQQRCHLLDENWTQILSYPKNALSNPHSGIADVELADLNGDGVPQLCVGYWGVVGVQGVSLSGERIWSCRAISNVISMAAGAPNEKGQCNLFCTNNTGSLVALDGKGERVGAITVPGHPIHWIVASDLRHDGQLLWCGLTATKVGENVALGISPRGEVLWSYPLPVGIAPQPIEPILSGKVTREGPDQWILPGADSSIHILSADGKLVDKFNYGEMLQGLATVNINGQPVLVVATPKGLEAWKIE